MAYERRLLDIQERAFKTYLSGIHNSVTQNQQQRIFHLIHRLSRYGKLLDKLVW